MSLSDDVLRCADEAFDRVMAGVPEQLETMPPELAPADALRWAGDRVTELLAGLAELPLDRWLEAPDSTEQQPTTGEPVTVRARRGEVAEVRIWVHLVGQVPTATMRFALSQMVGPSGSAPVIEDVEFVPAELLVPAPVGASTVLRLAVPEHAEVGYHHGLVVGRGVPGAVVPITVVVA